MWRSRPSPTTSSGWTHSQRRSCWTTFDWCMQDTTLVNRWRRKPNTSCSGSDGDSTVTTRPWTLAERSSLVTQQPPSSVHGRVTWRSATCVFRMDGRHGLPWTWERTTTSTLVSHRSTSAPCALSASAPFALSDGLMLQIVVRPR